MLNASVIVSLYSATPKEFDLAGMDQSWNSSQWVDVSTNQPAEDIPQVDGAADNKPGLIILHIL